MISFMDADCMIGKRVQVREGAPRTKEDLQILHETCGIFQAMAYHSTAKQVNMMEGNLQLLEEIAEDSHWIPQWIVMPGVWDDFWSPEELFDRMKKANVPSVRMVPKTQNHSLRPFAMSKLMEGLIQRQVPIFIDRNEFESTDQVYDFCTAFPQAKIVVCATSYGELRRWIPILEQCPNLRLETGTLIVHNGIREICRHLGAERLIFGSGAPENSITAAFSLIRYADISEEEMQKIASGNLQKLLGEVTL